MDRKINAAAFKAQCLKLIDEVAESGQPSPSPSAARRKVQIVAVREKPKTLWGATKGTFGSSAISSARSTDDYDEDRRLRLLTGEFE